MNLIFVVIIVLFVLCFLSLKKESSNEHETVGQTTGINKTQMREVNQSDSKKKEVIKKTPKKLRYCLKCYIPCRPKDLVCRECGEVLQPEALEAYEAEPKKIRYCVNCYVPCAPNAVVCDACGYVIRTKYFKQAKQSNKKIRYCVKCYTLCKPGDMICRECGHELYE